MTSKSLILFALFCVLLFINPYSFICAEESYAASTDVASTETLDGSASKGEADEKKDWNKKDEEVMGDKNVVDELSEDEQKSIEANAEKHEFQAEVHRLMDIIINSLYSKREIFIRELISNAADALDKQRYLSLTSKQSSLEEESNHPLTIKINFDREKRTLSITDTGIGMTKEDLIKNLGVVAKSGTSEFVEAATKGATNSDALALIGQFGVGFYSVYLVANKVTVVSKHVNDTQWVWESTADRTFSVSPDPRGSTLIRGTQVILHLKEDAYEFTNADELKRLISRYSEFINYPIYLYTSKEVEHEVPVEAEEELTEEKKDEENKENETDGEEKKEEGEDLDVSDEEEGKKPEKPATKTEKQTVWNYERINDVKAIWTRSSKEISEEEYTNFYRTLVKDETAEVLDKIHFTAEGEISFRAILYIPKRAMEGLYDKFYEKSTALKLYVRRVLISDEFDEFLPRYLNFVKGVVDSEDLPLNVSRETLAQSRVLKVMSKKILRKCLEMLQKMSDDEQGDTDDAEEGELDEKSKDAPVADKTRYKIFWQNYSKSIKLGCIDDRANKSKLTKLLRFQTSKSDKEFVSLDKYVERMKKNQKYIYYITGESLEAVESSPFLEKLNAKGYEVIFMTDPLDEYLMQAVTDYEGTTFQSVTKDGLKIGNADKEKQRLAKYKEEFKDLTKWMENIYGDKVDSVTVSNRINKSPLVVVTGRYGWSANMERIMQAQTFTNQAEHIHMLSRKTVEINPHHPIIKTLKDKVTSGESDNESNKDLAYLLYDAALLQSGFIHKTPHDFATRIHRVVSSGLNLDPHAEITPDEEDDDDDEDTEEDLGQTPASDGPKVEIGEDGQQTLKFKPDDMTSEGGASPQETEDEHDHDHDEL